MSQSDTGSLTVLLSDIQGNTRLLQQLPEAMAKAQARHDILVMDAIATHQGRIFRSANHSIAAVFDSARDALDAALAIQRIMRVTVWEDIGNLQVRLAVASGKLVKQGEDYSGPALDFAQRMLALAEGSQTMIDGATRDPVRASLPEGVSFELVDTQSLTSAPLEPVYRVVSAELALIAQQQVICGSCGASHLANTLFCDECGHLLTQSHRPETDPLGLRRDSHAGMSASPSYQVELVARDGKRRLAFTLASTLLIGRTDPSTDSYPDIDFGATDGPDSGVSRRHARLHLTGGQILLEDLNSLNGTYVQNLRLIAHRPYALQSGDELQFGKVIYTISW